MKRRDALRLGGVAALAGTAGPALVSCSGSGGDSDVGNKGKKLAPWPTYVEFDGPKPDLPGDGKTGLQGAYTKYPKKVESAGWDTPGDGTEVTCSVVTYGVPPKGGDSFVKAVNKALGINLKLKLIPSGEFQETMSTMTTSDDLPDLMMFGSGVTVPREQEFIKAKCADMSEYLSGDNIKDYPGLANIPTYAWKGVGRIGGKIYGIPSERPIFGGSLMVNRTEFDKANVPLKWNKDDYVAAMKHLTKGKKYALGLAKDAQIDYWTGSLGAPNVWSVDGGKFTTTFDTDQYADAIKLLAKQFADKQVYPDSPNISNVDNKTYFSNTTLASYRDGWGAMGPWAFDQAKGDFTVDFAYPFSADATPWTGTGYFGYTVFKKAKAKRLKLLLAVCNFLAAPFGTKEYELFNFGVEGKHFTREDDGTPKPTKLWNTSENKTNYPVPYVASAPTVLFYPGYADRTEAVYEWEKELVKSVVHDPSVGIRSKTQTEKGADLSKSIQDAYFGVIFHGKSMSTFSDAVKEWHSKGGDDMAKELAEEYSASKD
ncbi:MAG TPA: hypothetical protein VE172_24380 [Stackebrandtia sp.]|jgi:putative aldouronate transport system substrate-binding protein|uniref:hypothetical protein n=1 Tax=Stackebrandtia sp. TaxID=2023065 RepID=UPI002D40C0E1|nr:hypothetical protein [Stackebrandtia sp.]HZE41948.1 hypothetical protein [Stackebrandtia sp.]